MSFSVYCSVLKEGKDENCILYCYLLLGNWIFKQRTIFVLFEIFSMHILQIFLYYSITLKVCLDNFYNIFTHKRQFQEKLKNNDILKLTLTIVYLKTKRIIIFIAVSVKAENLFTFLSDL